MILIVPAAILLMTAVIILVVRIIRPSFPALWLIAVLGSLAAWIVILFLRLRLPAGITIINWSVSGLIGGSPRLLLDFSSWPYSFALATITLAVVLISPGQLKLRSEVINIAGSLSLGGLGLLAVLAANPITLLLAWSAVDIIELAIMLRNDQGANERDTALRVFASRFAGMMMVLWSFLSRGSTGGSEANFTNLNPEGGLLLLLGIGLRIGVLPLHLPYSQDTSIRRGQGTLLRMVPVASSLVVLSRFQSDTIAPGSVGWLSVFAFITLILASIRWAFEKDDLHARPFWILSLSAMSLVSVLNGQPFLSISWGMLLLYLGAVLFLLDDASRFMRILAYFGLLSLIGTPFSLSASGFYAALAGANPIWWTLFLLVSLLVGLGYLFKVHSKADLPADQEQIIYLTYPLSSLLLVFALLFTGVFGWHNSRVIGIWYVPIILLVLAAVLIVWNRRTGRLSRIIDTIQHFSSTSASPRLVETLEHFINFNWLFTLLRRIFVLIGRLIDSITFLLEGNGGILWAFLILAVLLAVVRTGGD